MTPTPRRDDQAEPRLTAAVVVLAAGTFVADLFLPLGVAGGAPYTVLVLLGLWSRRRGFIPVVAGAATVLTVLGGIFSPPGEVLWMGVVNRSLTVLAIGAIAAVLCGYKGTERELAKTQRERQAYLEVAEFALVVLDRDANVRLINRKGCEILGYEEDEVEGRNWFENFIPEERSEALREVHRQLIAGDVAPVEFHENAVRTRDGEERLVAWHNAVLRDEKGVIVATVSSGEDVTERRKAQQEQRKRESLAKLGEMAAVVAHEVKNPIAGISGAIQIIGDRLPPDSEDREVVQSVLERLDSLNKMSQDLLEFARPRAPQFQPVQLQPLLRGTADLLAKDPELDRIRVEIAGPELTLPGDLELLQHVFLNLLLNAAHAMGGNGHIEVTVEATGGRGQVGVSDRGPGIPEEIRERIFEPFFTTKHRGTGLGLPIARRVVEAHGGEISVDCPAAGGTTFLVSLPETH